MDIEKLIDRLRFNDDGLIPAIIQDIETKDVMMMAWMSAESLRHTLEKSETVFWSRSRQKLWHKGETSGNMQRVVEMRVDCDADVLLVLVEAAGPACHTGERVCFFRTTSEFTTTETPYV